MGSFARRMFWAFVAMGAVAVVIGAVALYRVPPTSMRREWDPVAVMQTGVGLLVAASLQVLLARRLDVLRSDRELIQREIDRACERLTECVGAFDACAAGARASGDVVSAAKRLGMAITTVSEMLKVLSEHDRDHLRGELESHLRAVRAALTDSESPSVAELGRVELAARDLRVQLFRTSRAVASW